MQLHVCVHERAWLCMWLSVYMCMCVHVCISVHACMCVWMCCLHVHVYLSVRVWKFIHTYLYVLYCTVAILWVKSYRFLHLIGERNVTWDPIEWRTQSYILTIGRPIYLISSCFALDVLHCTVQHTCNWEGEEGGGGAKYCGEIFISECRICIRVLTYANTSLSYIIIHHMH